MKKLLALALILTFILPPTLVSANRTRGVFLSGLRTDFDGVDERMYKDTPTGLQTDSSGSMCMWFNGDTVSGADGTFLNVGGIGDTRTGATFAQINFGIARHNALMGNSNFHIAYFHRNGAVGTAIRLIGNSTVSASTLYFGCWVSNSSAIAMYLNGTSQTISIFSGSNNGNWFGDLSELTGTVRYAIGNVFRNNAWATTFLDGKMDGQFITTDQLTQAQVTALYNSGKPIHPCVVIDCANVRSFWKMGEDNNGSITTTYDAKGVNHLTGENMENADIVTTSYY